MIPADWTPHRRPDDRELLGWIRPDGDDWAPVDLLGRELGGPRDWLEAEQVLEDGGLGWLAEIWMLERPDAAPLRVRIVEVTPGAVGERGRVVVKTDDFGAVDAPYELFELEWPAPAALRRARPDDPVASPWG